MAYSTQGKAMKQAQKFPRWTSLKALASTPDDILASLGIVVPPVDVAAVAAWLGVTVRYVPRPGWSGALTVKDRDATIWVNENESVKRQRFTIAHELGHLMLHDTTHAFRDESYSGSEMESEANRFAADLLMPMWMVGPISLTATNNAKVSGLAELFGVSNPAMRRRLLESFGVPVPPL